MKSPWHTLTATRDPLQMAGRQALATDDVMETLRSVLSQVLPTTYSDVDPQAYMNVTVCPAPAPAPAPGAPGKMTNVGGRRLKVDAPSSCGLLAAGTHF